MGTVGQESSHWPRTAAIFGASGGIGRALCEALAERGVQHVYAGARNPADIEDASLVRFAFDLTDEQSIAGAAEAMSAAPPQLVLVSTGVLTLEDGNGPERTYKAIKGEVMEQVLWRNTIGPALIAKHMLPLLPREGRAVFAALSARVGSISDNRIGGWHSYRASKAALNMLVRNWSIEMARTHKEAVVVSLHPGTVDTALSEPFQSNLPDGQLTSPDDAAQNLLSVIDGLGPEDSGYQYDWKGERVPD